MGREEWRDGRRLRRKLGGIIAHVLGFGLCDVFEGECLGAAEVKVCRTATPLEISMWIMWLENPIPTKIPSINNTATKGLSHSLSGSSASKTSSYCRQRTDGGRREKEVKRIEACYEKKDTINNNVLMLLYFVLADVHDVDWDSFLCFCCVLLLLLVKDNLDLGKLGRKDDGRTSFGEGPKEGRSNQVWEKGDICLDDSVVFAVVVGGGGGVDDVFMDFVVFEFFCYSSTVFFSCCCCEMGEEVCSPLKKDNDV